MTCTMGACHSACLNDVLAKMSVHLNGLAQMVTALEDSTSDQATFAREVTEAEIKTLQNLDYLRQSLEDFSKLTHFLGNEHAAGGSRVAVLDALMDELQLESVKQLVRFSTTEREIPGSDPEHGAIDLF